MSIALNFEAKQNFEITTTLKLQQVFTIAANYIVLIFKLEFRACDVFI